MLREAHEILMHGVRGQSKAPGEFRSEQNWIGLLKTTIEEASFVPISHMRLQEGMERWLKYVLLDDLAHLDPLTQLAVIHAEFEALHPFNDGNGRLGRMLIPLFLYWRHILKGPNFYMSGYLEANRDRYVFALSEISRIGVWTEWVEFFLEGITEQALENQRKASMILDLHRKMSKDMPMVVQSKFISLVIEFMFTRPVFSSTHIIDALQVPTTSIKRVLEGLKENGVLRVISQGSGKRPTLYAFSELINLAEGRKVL